MIDMPKWFRIFLATSVFVILLSSAPLVCAIAQNSPAPAVAATLSNNDLDALLEAKDWNRLSAALRSPRDAASAARVLNWLHAKLDSGAGFLVALAYMHDLWGAGSALNVQDPGKDLRVSAGLIALYTYELIVIDGAKCEDRTAPDNRVNQLFGLNRAVFSFFKSLPTELKTRIVDVALALEKKTAPLREDDDLICRDGLEQMKAGLEKGTQKEIPNTSGHYGKTVAVTPPADWVPKFVPASTYIPMQSKAREAMRERLLKLAE